MLKKGCISLEQFVDIYSVIILGGLNLETKRAKEISESPVMAHVSHNGTQVYIQSVNDQSETAHVYHLKNPNERYEVQVSQLEEGTTLK